MTHGRRFRIDTTVVETNVHYATDSSRLQDGVRVLTRTLQRASRTLGDAPSRVRNRLRAVGRLGLAISHQARSPETRDALVRSCRRLMGTTRAVLRDAATMVRRIGQRLRTVTPPVAKILADGRTRLQQMRPVVNRDPRPDPGPPARRRYARSRQGAERLRAAHRSDSKRQDRQAGGGSALHRKHKVYLQIVTVATVPYSYEEHLIEIYRDQFKHLRLLVLDPYDLALGKITRNLDVDIEDVKHLARSSRLDLDLLESRYVAELRPFAPGPHERRRRFNRIDTLRTYDDALKRILRLLQTRFGSQAR